MMGLSVTEFDDMTLCEFDAVEQGYLRRQECEYRTAMNIQRWGSFVSLSGLVDLKGREVTEVLPLPWDEKSPEPSAQITRKEIETMKKEAIETVKRFDAWQRK